MTGRGITTLRSSVERGQYEVDSRAIAEKIVRSWMLVAAKGERPPVRADKREPVAH
jgi:Anti-sigma-28 factor, FlgM